MPRFKRSSFGRRRTSTVLLGLAALGLTSCNQNSATQAVTPENKAVVADASKADWREQYAYSVGVQAYIYAYPVIYLSDLRHKWATDSTSHPYAAPNHLYHFETIADASYKDGGSPNNDTLYSWGFLDLSKEPVVITHADMGTRYFTFELADMYADNFGYIGKRTTGSKAGAFLIAGPGWSGKTPAGITAVIRSPTPTALVFARIFVDGPEDVPVVKKLQLQDQVVPLSLWGKPNATLPENRDVWAPYDRKTDPLADWKTINRAMSENPPNPKDKQMLELFATVGIGANLTKSFEQFDDATKRGLAHAAADGHEMIETMVQQGVTATIKNGWLYPSPNFGRQGLVDEFQGRAICAAGGIICNDPAEAVYVAAFTDVDGHPLQGTNNYTLRFEKGGLPQVKEFWSVTMYGPDHNLVPNPLNRFAIRDRTPGMKQDADGSTTFYLQPDSPGTDKESNWLPTPKQGNFNMLQRAYVPGEAIIKQTWTPPTVKIASH
jgi:hypothetical protein